MLKGKLRTLGPAACVAAGLLCSACATSAPIPDWVINPEENGGMAATECVPAAGNFALEREAANAKARAAIARQVEVKVAAMAKVYERSSTSNDASSRDEKSTRGDSVKVETAFENVSKQVAEQALAGSKPVRGEFLTIQGQEQFCSLVRLPAEAREALYRRAIAGTGLPVTPEQDKQLYQEFTAPP